MTFGRSARPPAGYAAFCLRRPAECGPDQAQVSAQAERFAGRRDRAREPWGAALRPVVPAPAGLPAGWTAVAQPLQAVIQRASVITTFEFLDPAAAAQARVAPPPLTPELWATLKRVNDEVNAALASREDRQAFGVEDFWDLPLEAGRAAGDCEDYVLEKRRALRAAGLDPRQLNIALVVTPWGETHAVLLVNTSQGEYVLDNLTHWVRRWNATPYAWVQRQVDGQAFDWVRVQSA